MRIIKGKEKDQDVDVVVDDDDYYDEYIHI